MAISERVANVLNEQINKEIYSSYLYLTFANYFDIRGLKGFANWYVIQTEEELAHAKILRRYLLDNDVMPVLNEIKKPDVELKDDVEVITEAYNHELYITQSINECYTVAREENDYRTMQLLDWFVKEQGEEETNASEMLTNMKLFAGDAHSLYMLDREYQARSYKAPADMEL